MEAQLSDAKVKFTKGSKIIRGLEKKLDMLSPNFYEAQIKSVDIALSLNSDLILNSKKQKEILQIEFSNIPNLIMEYETLEQELKIAKENLSRLVVAKEAFLLELSQKKIPWQVISPIYVEKTQNSALGNLFLLGIIASIIIGLFAAYLKDSFDNTFKDENDIKLEFDLPLLTDIPSIKGNDIFEKFENYDNSSKILETDSRDNNYREPFVELVTAINFLNTEKIKIFSITSFLNSEGKTLMNIFLDKTLEKIGFKVLIVDLNLRFPKIHNILSIKNEFGLSNLLIDEKLKLEKVIKDFNLNNNDSFKVLTSGSNISEPIKLLNSPKFIEFSEDLRNNKKFDYVIFDMPAINGLSDFNLIAQYCDKLILLITLKQVQKKFSLMNSIKFEDIRNKFIGILINSKYVKD